MRKIETKDNTERKDRRNKIIIGVVLVVLMLFSTAGYAFFSGDKNSGGTAKISIDGRDFYAQGNFWTTSIDNKPYYFTYLPNETGSISLNKKMSDYSGKTVYFAKTGLAEDEIARNLGNFAGRIGFACMENENCTENWPIKNCTSSLIIIKEQDVGSRVLRAEDNCVFIISNDTIRDADAFVYRVLGII